MDEIKRITLNAGSQLNRIESTLRFSGTNVMMAAVGMNVPKGGNVTLRPNQNWTAVWQATDGNDQGMLGTGPAMPRVNHFQIRQAAGHLLMQVTANTGQPLVGSIRAKISLQGGPRQIIGPFLNQR